VRIVADPQVLRTLLERLQSLTPDSRRRWGTMTAHEMLCHLGDAAAMVTFQRPRTTPARIRSRPVVKALGLWAPVRWPRGWPSSPFLIARMDGTKPTDFARDLARAIEGLNRIAIADTGTLEPAHGFFGVMSTREWQRWAYRHTDHHLRQFGL